MRRKHGQAPALEVLVTAEELQQTFELVDAVHLPQAVANYIARLVSSTHPRAVSRPKSAASL